VRRCPFCAEEILSEAIVCKHCKKSLPSGGKTFVKIFFGITGGLLLLVFFISWQTALVLFFLWGFFYILARNVVK
jgi:hypothetical protein